MPDQLLSDGDPGPKEKHISFGDIHGNVYIAGGDIYIDSRSHSLANGKPFFKPTLPPCHIPRHDMLAVLKGTVLDTNSSATQLIAIHGMGGSGKSVLIQSLCTEFQEALRERYPDGIVWISVGREPGDIAAKLRQIGIAFGDAETYYETIGQANARLKSLLEGKSILLILDDIWEISHLKHFQVINSSSKTIITTRVASVADFYAAERISLGMLTNEQSLALLQEWHHTASPTLQEIADRLNGHPLALRLAGVSLQSMSPEEWLHTYQSISEITVGPPSELDDPEVSVNYSIKLSVDRLEQNARLYYSLGIFPEDLWIPEDVAMDFWCNLRPDFCEEDASKFVRNLEDLALIERSKIDKRILLHDLLHDFTKNGLKQQNAYERMQQSLLTSINPSSDPSSWYVQNEIKFPEYIYYFLPYHMEEAGWRLRLFELLKLAPSALEAQFAVTASSLLEQLVLKMYVRYWNTNSGEARSFLNNWLSRGKSNDTGMTAKTVAVKCAQRVGYDEGLIAGLLHTDPRVRQTAIAQTYHRYLRDKEAGISILNQLVSTSKFIGFPRIKVILRIFDILVLLLSYEYRVPDGSAERIARLGRIGGKAIKAALLMSNPVLGPVTKFIRPQLANFAVNFIVDRIKENNTDPDLDRDLATGSNATYEEFQYLFAHGQAPSSPARRLLPYLNPDAENLDFFSDVTLEDLLTSYDGTLAFWVGEYVLLAHGVRNPDSILPFVREIFFYERQPEWRDQRQISMSFLWRRSVLHQAVVEQRWLDTAREMCESYYSDIAREYGRYTSRLASTNNIQPPIHYYPIKEYSEIWNRVNPAERVDLADQLFARAREQADKALILHILRGFSDPRAMFLNTSPLVDQCLDFALDKDKDIRRITVKVLARLRARKADAFDGVIARRDDLRGHDVIQQIRALSFSEPVMELMMASGELFTTMLSNPPSIMKEWLYDSLDEALAEGELEKGLKIVLAHFLQALDRVEV